MHACGSFAAYVSHDSLLEYLGYYMQSPHYECCAETTTCICGTGLDYFGAHFCCKKEPRELKFGVSGMGLPCDVMCFNA